MPTTDTRAASSDGGEDPIERLIAECLVRMSQGGSDPFDEVCAANPDVANELARRRAGLVAMGLWGRGPEATPIRIGPFEVLRELGRGGMGVVYLANQTGALRRLVAVKVIAGRPSEQVRLRFEAERQALAMMAHPGIAQVLEAGTTSDGQPWYAMEFVDGLPITAWCDGRGLSVDERLALFLQLCDAVQHAHQQGVLHRDLKPGNVLVVERDGRPVVKVIDFGLAKLASPDDDQRDLTEAGQVLGTLEYMSPEQLQPGVRRVDTRADVYALGVMLYELCAGALPFDFAGLRREGFQVLQRAVCERLAPVPSTRVRQLGAASERVAERAATSVASLVRRLRGDLDWITGMAIAKEPERRYASASELAADVRRHLADEPVTAGPPSALYQLWKFARRYRVAVSVAVVALLGLIVTLVVVAQLLFERNESLARFDSLRVALDMDSLERFAVQDIWPLLPGRVPAMDAQLAVAERVRRLLPAMRAQLAAIAAQGRGSPDDLQFADARAGYLHDRLRPLVERIEAASVAGGIFDGMRSRRDWAAERERRTLSEQAAAWGAAAATIADLQRCPHYGGLRFEPMVGLVPLGLDPTSGLFEFALPMPGERLPERADGRWRVAADTCLVFVLVPGGDTRFGLDWPDERLPELTDILDTESAPRPDGVVGGVSVPVRLDPFLIAKYEVTQAQWQRVMESNPSTYSRENYASGGVDETHPVGSISAPMAEEYVRRIGASLPTTAQWQHAARAGSEAPWWTGWERRDWYGKENLPDRSTVAWNLRLEVGQPDSDYDDGFPLTAPVDALRPNPFGLHHVLGNVREWSADPAYRLVDATLRDGDGALLPNSPEIAAAVLKRDVLGASWMTIWERARSTKRTAVPAQQASATFGLRPAMLVIPAAR